MILNNNILINELQINKKLLDDKKQQTEYKIRYIVEYIRLWLIISSEREGIKNINFIDCMCNAGIYADGDLGTAIEVLLLFKERDVYKRQLHHLVFNDVINYSQRHLL